MSGNIIACDNERKRKRVKLFCPKSGARTDMTAQSPLDFQLNYHFFLLFALFSLSFIDQTELI